MLRQDLSAGLVVFLVALPLCLGVALASNTPLLAGIIAGIIGGCVVGLLSDSPVSVSGPAAGLAVIVATSIDTLESYEAFLAAVVLAGLMQIVLGLIRAGAIGDYVPNAVIKGMLAGIGLVIVLKQIPHALGYDLSWIGDLSFQEANDGNTLSSLSAAASSMLLGALVVSVCSLVLLILWDRLVSRGVPFFTTVPGPLAVVVLGIALNQGFRRFAPALYISERKHLVDLPVGSFRDLLHEFAFPDVGALTNPDIWSVAATLAVVASIETLLSLEAADRIDPYRRISSPNRELWAQGVGNILSGLIGGLPITSVVLRTSANVQAGGHSRQSTIVHGLLLLVSAVFIPQVLTLIPLACLSAILIMIGYKLTKPALYVTAYRLGWDQLIPFVATVAAIVFTDLLKGVLIGFACGLLFVIRSNHHRVATVVSLGPACLVRLNKDVTFVNKAELRTKLRALAPGSDVVIDGTRALYIDRDIVELVEDFQTMATHKGISVELKQFHGKSASRVAP